MISFDALPGNRSLKASLRRALAGRVPQTILLSGDDSRSLETLSTALAAGILCEADGPRPCGACLAQDTGGATVFVLGVERFEKL